MRYHVWFLAICCSSAAADTTWNSLISCRNVADPNSRVACYDSTIDALLDQDRPEKTFGAAPTSVVVEPEPSTEPPLDEVVAHITAVTTNARGKWTIELDNGQRWVLTDPDRSLLVVQGEQVTIHRARFGSFQLERTSGSRAVRVKRVE
jgi:hypothetical protein